MYSNISSSRYLNCPEYFCFIIFFTFLNKCGLYLSTFPAFLMWKCQFHLMFEHKKLKKQGHTDTGVTELKWYTFYFEPMQLQLSSSNRVRPAAFVCLDAVKIPRWLFLQKPITQNNKVYRGTVCYNSTNDKLYYTVIMPTGWARIQ